MGIQDFNKEFEKFFNELVQRVQNKQVEYARNGDPFHNFNMVASARKEQPETALLGMAMKHIISMFDMIDDIEQGYYPNSKMADEKLGDIIVYMCLLRTMIHSKNNPVELPF